MIKLKTISDTQKLIQIDGSLDMPNHCASFPLNPTKAKFIYAVDKSPMNNLSPRVVSIGRKPRRKLVGDLISQKVITQSINKMHIKNTATGVVHAIQLNMWVLHQTRPIAKPLAM
jgi:hypothetical protein